MLLWLAITALSIKTQAQSTICNAGFSSVFITGNTVKFTPVVNDSPLVHHLWNFGDGSVNSQVVSPTHSYFSNGTFLVTHTVVRHTPNNVPVCTQTVSDTIVIQQAPPNCTLVVNFSWTSTVPNPLTVSFQNLSVPLAATDSITWQFGDSTISHDVNPVHTYANAGTYTVCLIVKKYPYNTSAPCIRYICKTVVVHEPCTLVANFTSQPDPNHPLRIKFTNTSTPLNASDSVRWTFGDGTSVNGLQSDPNVANPTHIYANAGTYTVCIRVKKNSSATTPVACVREKCSTITVTAPCNFSVNFSWRLDSINPRKVYFTNLTILPVSGAIAVWNFGDGTTATSWNAVHEYALSTQYRVCLRIYLAPNSNCVREKCDTITIPVPVPPCTQLSKYHYQVYPNDRQKYKFTADYINPALQYTWTFGDGTGSHDPVAVHRYAQPGVYVACLTVWRGPNCASTTCKEIRVLPQINCDTAHVWYTYQRSPNVPNKIQFFANASLQILDQVWYITKVGGTVATPPVILHQNNPIYLFQDTGYYRVCLKATLLGGCVKEYCNYIRIEQVSNACELQAFPNPASSTVNVNLYLTQPGMIHASVYNSLNVLVLQQNQQGNTGNNLVTLNVGNLTAGQYTIRFVYGNRVCYAGFLKL